MSKRITFEDEGQDFLTFDVDNEGYIKDVKPFQFSIWSKYRVTNFKDLSIGDYVDLSHIETKEKLTLKYKIENVKRILILRKD